MNTTFFFYDLETSGLSARNDRIMQFAGQRTSIDLNPIGEPINILIKIPNDTLPSPSAINVTGITPQATLRDGITEADFCRYVTENIFTPNTIALGYNTVRFDDEFMRAIFWRNFYDPYEWQWKDGRSRWDMLDVVRLTRALRPEGINWPFTDDGKPTNRLELLTKLNGLSHEHAHDALSDVYATIAVASLIRDKQPKLFQYLYKMRDKKQIKKFINLDNKTPFVYASGRYPAKHNKTTVAVPLTASRNGNILVFDLRYNLDELLALPLSQSEASAEQNSANSYDSKPNSPSNIVKELCYNKCPTVAPTSVLDVQDGWNKISLSKDQIEQNLKSLLAHPEFAEQMRTAYENRSDFPPAVEPEAALYEGFLDDSDRIKVSAIRNASPSQLADFHPDFHDPRLPNLLLHYKGRNFPETLSESEATAYEEYRKERLNRASADFISELDKVTDDFTRNELLLYMQSLSD